MEPPVQLRSDVLSLALLEKACITVTAARMFERFHRDRHELTPEQFRELAESRRQFAEQEFGIVLPEAMPDELAPAITEALRDEMRMAIRQGRIIPRNEDDVLMLAHQFRSVFLIWLEIADEEYRDMKHRRPEQN